MSTQRLKRSLLYEDDASHSSRPRKRPGGASRLSNYDKATTRDVLEKRQQEREQEAKKAAAVRGVQDVVRQHYNAVPQRGRDWRKTESRIKGLRSFNNWVKSTIIHKFSPDGSVEPGKMLRVLDMGCGKGGDLGKWQQAPQPVELLVGIDPAEISVDQARERYLQMRNQNRRGGRGPSGTFDAYFYAQDAFGRTIGDIPIIRDVGYDAVPHARRGGGFDVVSMMFCMHYAFESEAKTRGMLQNVSGSLRKGGRFIGVIPSSDIIRAKVQAFHAADSAETRPAQEPAHAHEAATESQIAKSAALQAATPVSQEAKSPVIQEPKPALEESRSVVQEPEPVLQESKSVLQESKSVLQESKSVLQASKLVLQESKSVIQEPKPALEGPKPILQESKPNLQEPNPIPPQQSQPAPAEDSDPVLPQESQAAPAEVSDPVLPRKSQLALAEASNPAPPQEPEKSSVAILSEAPTPVPVPKIPAVPVAEWGNSIYRVRFSGPTPKDGMFRPPYGWKYSYFMEEAVEEIPEYVVPWEAFRA